MPKIQPKVIQDSNPDFRINPDPDVCRIYPKMLWMHDLVDISHFAKYVATTEVLSSPIKLWNYLSAC